MKEPRALKTVIYTLAALSAYMLVTPSVAFPCALSCCQYSDKEAFSHLDSDDHAVCCGGGKSTETEHRPADSSPDTPHGCPIECPFHCGNCKPPSGIPETTYGIMLTIPIDSAIDWYQPPGSILPGHAIFHPPRA